MDNEHQCAPDGGEARNEHRQIKYSVEHLQQVSDCGAKGLRSRKQSISSLSCKWPRLREAAFVSPERAGGRQNTGSSSEYRRGRGERIGWEEAHLRGHR